MPGKPRVPPAVPVQSGQQPAYIDNFTGKTVRGCPPAGMLRRLHKRMARIVAPFFWC